MTTVDINRNKKLALVDTALSASAAEQSRDFSTDITKNKALRHGTHKRQEETSPVDTDDQDVERSTAGDSSTPADTPSSFVLAQGSADDSGIWSKQAEATDGPLPASTNTPTPASTAPQFNVLAIGSASVAVVAGTRGTGTSQSDTAAPRVQSLATNAAAQTITLTYNETLDADHLPAVSAFQVTTGGVANTVDNISVNGNTVILHLAKAFSAGNTVSVTYTEATQANDINVIQDIAGNDATGFSQGIVADGYIRGASIYIDTNNNGTPDANELLTGVTTDANGNFFLPSSAPRGTLIAVGGVNIDTGLPQLIPLKAPAGSVNVNPLTHLTLSVMEASALSGKPLSANAAADLVANALGIQLPTGTQLLNFDPLGGSASDGYSLAAQKATSAISSFTLLSSLGNQADAFSAVDSLANLILSKPNATVDLTDTSTIDSLLSPLRKNTPTLVANIASTNSAIAQASQFSQITEVQTAQLSAASELAQQVIQKQSVSSNSLPLASTTAPATSLFYEADATINQQDVINGYKDIQGATQAYAHVCLQLSPGLRKVLQADKDGQWVYTLTNSDMAAMGQGQQTLRSWTTGPTGNRSTVTELNLLIDTQAPAAFTPVLVTNSDKRNPVFQFVTEKGATIQFTDDSGFSQTLGTGTGTIQDHQVSISNYEGIHKLNFEVVDPSGNTQKATYTYTLDRIGPQISITPSSYALKDGETTNLNFTFEQEPSSFSLSDIQVAGAAVSQLSGTGLTRTALLTADTDPTTTNITISIAPALLTDSAGNMSKGVSSTVIVSAALPISLPDLAAASDAQFTNNLNIINNSVISAVGDMLNAELEKLPFLADLTQVASYIQSHLSITWNVANNTFGVFFQDANALFSAPLATSLGMEGLHLSLHTEKNFDITLSCNVNISGGYNTAYGGIYLDTSGITPCVTVTASATLPDDLTIQGTLGPLNINAVNKKTDASLSSSISLANQETPFTIEDIVQYANYRLQPSSATQGKLSSSQIASLQLIDNDPDYYNLGLFTPQYLISSTPESIVKEINSFFSSRDNRLTWKELTDVVSNPSTIGTIIQATVDATENLSFSINSNVTTGVGVVDSLIPNFSFDVNASAQQLGDINNTSLSYSLDAAITNAKVSSDVLTNLVAPTLQEAQKILMPLYGLVDIFHSTLPWKAQTYTSTVPEPNWYDDVNPVYLYDVVKGEFKEGLSTVLDSWVRSFYSALDVNKNGQVEVIELFQGPVQLGQSVLQQGQTVVDQIQVLLEKFKTSPASTIADWTVDGAHIPGLAIVGGPLSGAMAAIIAANVDTLMTKTNDIETQLVSLQTTMASINSAMNAFDQLLNTLEHIRTVSNTLAANQDNQQGVTLDGVALGNYGYHVSGTAGEVTVTEGIPSSNSTLNALLLSPVSDSSNTPPAYQSMLDDLKSIGINLPVLTDPNVLGKIISLQPVDLLTFDPNLPNVNLDFTNKVDFVALGQDIANLIELVGVPGLGASYSSLAKTVGLFATLDSKIFGSLTIDPNIDFGVDTAGLNQWFLAGMPIDLSGLRQLGDGFYASDHLTTTNGVTKDLPELSLQASLGLNNNLTIGSGFLGGNLNLTNSLVGQLLLDIADPSKDGKLRWSEIIDSIQNEKDLMAIDPSSALDLLSNGSIGGWLDFNKPIISADTLKNLGLNSTAVTAIQDTLQWFATAAENKYSWDIPFTTHLNLLGQPSDTVIPA